MNSVCRTLLLPLLALSVTAHASSIGELAPKLFIEQWVKGAPAQLNAGKHIYVVEFWATWCPPCRKSIPHLTELQQKYANQGVVVIGITSEPSDKVLPFVSQQGASMDYRVAVDTSGKTFNAWMKAFGESGIPHAFVVDRTGKVAWHGFPNQKLDRVLQQLVDGTFDIDHEKKVETGNRLVKAYVGMMVKASKPDPAASSTGEKILNEYSLTWLIPYDLAEAILTDARIRSRDVDLALRASNKAVEMTGGRSSGPLEMQARAMFASGKKQEAVQVQKKAIELCSDSSKLPNLRKFLALYEKGALGKR